MGMLGLAILIIVILVILVIVLGFDDTILFLERLFERSSDVIREGADKVIDET